MREAHSLLPPAFERLAPSPPSEAAQINLRPESRDGGQLKQPNLLSSNASSFCGATSNQSSSFWGSSCLMYPVPPHGAQTNDVPWRRRGGLGLGPALRVVVQDACEGTTADCCGHAGGRLSRPFLGCAAPLHTGLPFDEEDLVKRLIEG